MENKINQNNETNNIINNEEYENKINSFILMIQDKYNKNKNNIIISGKILYYISDATIINFNYKISKNSEENCFNKDILFCFEFIENKVPYIRVISNFINPTFYDGRNLFYCLINDYSNNYIFDKNNLDACEKIIDLIITGIKKFIINLKENMDIKVYIYYGEYTLNHAYIINDFLINQPTLKFFRIYELNNTKAKELKYIIITQLYFLIFEPINENKSLGKLTQVHHIKDVNFKMDNNNYYFKINKDKNNSIILKFMLTRGGYQGKKVSQKDIIECDANDYIALKNILEEKKKELNFENYLLVITKSKNLYAVNEKYDSNKKKFISKNRCNDYKKYI